MKLLRAGIALLLWCLLLGGCYLGTDVETLREKVKSEKKNPDLTGTISITPGGVVTTGTELTAAYSGSETVTYQWYKNGIAISGAIEIAYTPSEAGSYTATVSAAGYTSKTSATVTVTAASSSVITYTVTFNSNGGSNVATQTVNSGGTVTRPENPTRSDYAFDNWYSDWDLTMVYDFSTPVTGNITLRARWNPVYTVTFNSNGGNDIPDQIVEPDGTVTRPENPTRSDYAFDNWYSDWDMTMVYDFSTPVTENIVLYAKWNFSGDIPANSLAGKLSWLQDNAERNTSYTLEVNANESIESHTLSYDGKGNITITLIGVGANRIISLSSNGAMFTVDSGVTLILDNNVTLRGRSSNTDSLVKVNGMLIMNDGATITGNTSSDHGGGVFVGGTFTMSGGEISGNTAAGAGGGVAVYGTFTMSGGTISGNTCYYAGGGVWVSGFGTFTMNGGTISGNTAPNSAGGGVFADSGTFIMNGGKITGNTSAYTGGVMVGTNGGTFTMTDGEISGNTGNGVYVSTVFTMSGGEISGNTGGGVYLGGRYDNDNKWYSGTFTMSGGEISGNTADSYWSSGGSVGGGVYVDWGTFSKTGGTIYGYTAGDSKSNVVKDESGNIVNDRGHAVYAHDGGEVIKRRETTAGPGVDLSFDYNDGSPTWSGGWED